MFSIKGRVVSGTEKKNGIIVSVSTDEYRKIISECNALNHVFGNFNQALFPCYTSSDSEGYYAKVLLSKARKDQYDSLLKEGEHLFNVRVVPYSFENANTGAVNGYSLYYQGEFNVPKKFRRVAPTNATQEPL
jgi:hypothetical protein